MLLATGIDGSVHALDAWTGNLLWSIGLGNPLVTSKLHSFESTTIPTSFNSIFIIHIIIVSTHVSNFRNIIPGLDGSIYLSYENALYRLPITTQQIIASTNYIINGINSESDQILSGDKDTIIFALNIVYKLFLLIYRKMDH